ncbi:MAG: DUF2079 domain-containing protein, partial [Planctomycetota bacterium]
MKKLWWLVVVLEAALIPAACAALLPMTYEVAHYEIESSPAAAVNYSVFACALAPLLLAAFSAGPTIRKDPKRLAVALLGALIVLPVLARAAFKLAPFFLDPLLLALATVLCTASVLALREERVSTEASRGSGRRWVLVLLAACALTAFWLYAVQSNFLTRFDYGWKDSGLYYLRVKNTALGRGFLQETWARPPFYDHFDVTMLLLVPVYWVARGFRMIMWAHAVSLAAIAGAVYVYARGKGVPSLLALVFGAAVLLHPSISQMSYAYSYGFHPIVMAIAPVILSLHFWEKGRYGWFIAFALFAVLTEETVWPLYVGLGAVEVLSGRRARVHGAVLVASSIVLFLVVTVVVMPAFSGAGGYIQTSKYEHLGDTFLEVLTSPVTRPGAFWPTLFSPASVYYVLIILGGMFFLPLLAPRQFLYPVIVLVFTLLLPKPGLKIICYQYQALVIAAWFPGMVVGAQRLRKWLSKRDAARGLSAAAWAAVVSALVLSHFYGLAPFSRKTVRFQKSKSAEFLAAARTLENFARSVRPPIRVLATARAAMHFC